MSDSFDTSQQELWHRIEDPTERANCIVRTADRVEQQQLGRRERALQQVQMYESRTLSGLYASAYYENSDLETTAGDKVRLNQARVLVNTASAQIAGRQKPRAQFVTSGADWTTKRRAKKLEQFVEAVMMQRQGDCSDAFGQGRKMFRDKCVVDSGWLKFWLDLDEKQVRIGRVHPWEVMFDPTEAANGEVSNLWHIFPYDKYKLADEHPDFADEIMASPPLTDLPNYSATYGLGFDGARMIKLRECWRKRYSRDKPGAHSLVVGSSLRNVDIYAQENGKAEEYARDFFPFELDTWEPWFIGLLGTSLVDNIALLQKELNASLERRSEAERLCSNLIIFYPKTGVDEEDLKSNEIGIRVPYDPNMAKPEFVAPSVVSAGSERWSADLQKWTHDASGVSPQAATAQKEQGITAGVAIREIKDIGTERFAIQWQNHETIMAVGCARQIVALMEDYADQEGDDFTVSWPGGDFLKDLKWSQCGLKENQYRIQLYAVSGLINTPADRLQLATELRDRGDISKDTYLRIIEAKDIAAELDSATTLSRSVDRYIEEWLDATAEDEESGKFRYRGPPPRWIGVDALTESIIQVGRGYLAAELDDAPEYNLGWFIRYMKETDAQVQFLLQRQAALQAAAAGKPAPGPVNTAMQNGAPAPPAPAQSSPAQQAANEIPAGVMQ